MNYDLSTFVDYAAEISPPNLVFIDRINSNTKKETGGHICVLPVASKPARAERKASESQTRTNID